jgi:hypothetical protein
MSGERRDELAREGVEHLQAAAREVIRATRSLLDAAEELVEDPAAVQQLVGQVGSVAQAAAGWLRRDVAGRAGPSSAGDDDDGDDGRVQRIRVS